MASGFGKWLRLAASPSFAIMAALTALSSSPIDSLCSSLHGASLTGMFSMYLLMSALHLPAWLDLINRHHRGGAS
jgi:hypothetical protein